MKADRWEEILLEERRNTMLNQMGIKKKLVAAFIMIGLFTLLVGTFGLAAVNSTNKNTKDIYSNHFIPTTYLFEIQKNLMEINDNYVLMLYEKDILQTEKRLKEIETLQTNNQALFELYEDREKTISKLPVYQTMMEDMQVCSEIMNQLGVLLKNNNYSAAMNIAPSFHSRINLVDADIQKLIDENVSLADSSLLESKIHFCFLLLL